MFSALILFLPAGAGPAFGFQASWRIKIKEAAVVKGDRVRLGEIAEPVGEIDPAYWSEFSQKELWPSPEKRGKPVAMSGKKLKQALDHYLGDAAKFCTLPGRLVLSREGGLVDQTMLARMTAEYLLPKFAGLEAEIGLRDYRLPKYVFLSDPMNKVEIEFAGGKLSPGRVSLVVKELRPDGSPARRMTGSVFVDAWKAVAAAARPVNRDEPLGPRDVTFVRKNLAYLKGEVWDGKGGPYRVKSPVGQSQVLYRFNLEDLPAVARGDSVELVYIGDNIKLSVPAEALEDGSFGQSIPVRNLQSRRKVIARVRDARTVQVY